MDPGDIVNKGTYNNGTREWALGWESQGQTCELSLYIPHPGTPATLFMPTALPGHPFSLMSQAPRVPTHGPFSSVPLSFCVCCILHHVYYFPLDPSGEFLLENSAQLSHSAERTYPFLPASRVASTLHSPPYGCGSIILYVSVPH